MHTFDAFQTVLSIIVNNSDISMKILFSVGIPYDVRIMLLLCTPRTS